MDFDPEELDLASCQTLSHERGFPDSLYVEQPEPDDDSRERMHRICDRLESLIEHSAIQEVRFDDFHPDQIAVLFQRSLLRSIRGLSIASYYYGDDDEEGDEVDTRADDEAELIAKSHLLSRLRSLRLTAALSDHGLQALANASQLKRLESLSLSPSFATSIGYRELARSPLSKQIRRLLLDSGPLDSAEVQALTSEVWPELYSLTLPYFNLTAQGIQSLARSDAFPNLVELDLHLNHIGPKEVASLLENESWQLRSLDLSYCDLRSAGARSLARSPFVGQLRSLNLSSNSIGVQGVESLMKSRTLVHLRHLNLSYNRITGDKLMSLTKGEVGQQLTGLELRTYDDIPSVAEGTAFIRALDLPRIRHLSLSGNPLGSRGVQALVNKEWFQNIRILDLSSCRIGKAGAEALLEALDPSTMVQIDLSDNRIPRTIRQQFKERFWH